MNISEKELKYQAATKAIDAILEGETNVILKMATINCLLREHLDYYFWVGFYIVNDGALTVGPYQGTLGCLHISFDRGVCGAAARTRTTQIVKDVHALEQGTQHIACDPNTNSEIVVPVIDKTGELIAVFDVDSTRVGAFDEIDQQYLEGLVKRHF